MRKRLRLKSNYEIEQAKKKALGQEFEAKLKAAEDTLDELADACLPAGKYRSVTRERTAEYLSDARRSVRAVRNHEDWSRRR
jgi:hypothetical protein